MKIQSDSKIILVTGCSSGFGLLIAARLASKGHRVIATMRDTEKKEALLNEVKKRGGEVEVLQLDVTDKQSIKKACSHVKAQYVHIDVLINNAGYAIAGFFEDLTDKEIRGQMDTNFFGVQNVTREFIPLMRHHGSGKIINLSSVAGFSTSPCFGAYNASKWALEAFSESLRYELQPFGINVLLIEPGTYKTDIFYKNARVAANFDNLASPYYPISQFLKEKIQEHVNNCRKDPEDIAILAEKLINTKNPGFRNIPDFSSRILFIFRKFLPFCIYSQIIKAALSKSGE